MNSKFSISVKDIRAIKEAEVELNGITVLSGENGCGKTTLAKLLYGFIKTSINFDEVLLGYFYEKLSNSNALLRDFLPKEQKNFIDSESDDNLFFSSDSINSDGYISNIILPKIKTIRQKYEENEFNLSDTAFSRLLKLYARRVRKFEAENVIDLLNDYESYMQGVQQEISELKTSRNLKIFNSKFSEYFGENTDKWNYSFKEYDSSLIDKKSKTVIFQKSFSKVIYVDVPTVFDNFRMTIENTPLYDLRKILFKNDNIPGNNSITSIIEETLKGKISRKEDVYSRIFMYTAKNGQSIPLSQAASGLKCFAVLERLYANGSLNEDSLLIVDEPEVHLHPKWIVEYARVLVLIQKYLHTTILIASHNPDMISAIKYISEKEKVSDSLTFYVAEEVESEGFGKYKFKNLGTDIEEIFSSFNIALDRINQYGALQNE